MKNRILHFVILLMAILMFVIFPTHAQEATQEATVEAAPVSVVGEGTTVEDGGVNVTVNNPAPVETPANDTANEVANTSVNVLLAFLLTAAGVFITYLATQLGKYMPPETAKSLIESGMRFGFELALNRSRETENTFDDEFFMAGARARGYTVTNMPDGTYHLEPPKFTTTSTAPIASESAAASGAAAFPKP